MAAAGLARSKGLLIVLTLLCLPCLSSSLMDKIQLVKWSFIFTNTHFACMFVDLISGCAGGTERKCPETPTRSDEKEGESLSVSVVDMNDLIGESATATVNMYSVMKQPKQHFPSNDNNFMHSFVIFPAG